MSFLIVSCGYKNSKQSRDLLSPEHLQKSGEIWNGEINEKWFDKQHDEFSIYTAQEFAGLSNLVNSGLTSFVDKKIHIESDIMLNNTALIDTWNETKPMNTWTPIGTDTNPFKGIIDFKGHYVEGMYVNNEYLSVKQSNLGLFGNVELKAPDSPTYINNLNLKSSVIKVSENDQEALNVGSVVGKICNGGTFGALNGLANIMSSCKIVLASKSVKYLGGISGFTQANVFNSCYTGKFDLVNFEGNAGGITGGGAIPSFVLNSYSTVFISDNKLDPKESGVISFHGIPISCYYLKNTSVNKGNFAFGYARRIENNDNLLSYGNGTFSDPDSTIRITPREEVKWNGSSGLYGDNRIDSETKYIANLLTALNQFTFEKNFTFQKKDNCYLSSWDSTDGYPVLNYDKR